MNLNAKKYAMVEMTPEQWERILAMCRQILRCGPDDYGYIYDNALKIEDVMSDSDPMLFSEKRLPRLFLKEERSRIWKVASEKDMSVEEMVIFMNTLSEVKAATIERIEGALGRSIRDLA